MSIVPANQIVTAHRARERGVQLALEAGQAMDPANMVLDSSTIERIHLDATRKATVALALFAAAEHMEPPKADTRPRPITGKVSRY